MALTSSDYDGDIKLAVDLDAGDVKKASKELQQGIKEVFDATAGKKMDKTLKSIESSMSKATDKANELHSKLERIESTKIPTEEYSKLAKEVEASEKSVTKLSEKLELASEKVQSSDIAKKFTEAEDLYEKYQGLYESLRKTQGETDHATVAAKVEADKAKATLESLRGKYEQLLEPLNKMASELERSEDKLKESKKALDEMVASGKAFTLGEDSAEYEKTTDQLASVNNQMRVLLEQANKYEVDGDNIVKTNNKIKYSCGDAATAIGNIATKLGSMAKGAIINGVRKLANAFLGLGSSARSAGSSIGVSLRQLLGYSLGLASIRSVFNKIRSAITSSINDMVKFNGGMNTVNSSMTALTSALTYLKNSWASAFAPILNYVTPVLVTLINMISSVVNKIAQLMATLTGASSYLKAKSVSKDYAGSLSGGGGSKGKSAQEKYEEAKKKAQERYDKQLASVTEKRAKAAAKAEEQQAKAAAKLAKEQEKANGQLQAFDELNVITTQDLDDLADAYEMPEYEDPVLEEVNWDDFADAGAGAMEDMFEEVPVDSWATDLAEKLKEAWANADFFEIGQELGQKLKEALDSIPWDIIKDFAWRLAHSLATFINGFIATEGLAESIGKTIGEALNTALTFLNTFFDTTNWKAIGQFIGTGLQTAIDTIDWDGIGHLFAQQFNAVFDVVGGIAEKWSGSETGMKIASAINTFFRDFHWSENAESLSDFALDLLDTVNNCVKSVDWELVGTSIVTGITEIKWDELIKKSVDLTVNLTIALENLLGSAIAQINKARLGEMFVGALIGGIDGADTTGLVEASYRLFGRVIAGIWKFKGQIGGMIRDFFIALWEDAKEWWETDVVQAGEFTFEGLLEGIKKGLEDIGQWIYDNMLLPFLTGFCEIWGISSPSKVMEAYGGYITEGLLNGVKMFIQDIVNAFITLKTNVVNVITNMKNTLINIWNQLWNGIKSVINTILGGIESMVNGIIGGVNLVADALNTLQIDAPDWLESKFGIGSIGFNIPHISEISIPRLAQGAVIPPNSRFLAMLGDQKQGTNVEAPLDTIKQALTEALIEVGGIGTNDTADIVINIDGREIFRVIRDQDDMYKKSTGMSAFA